jgi:hypothetical protein
MRFSIVPDVCGTFPRLFVFGSVTIPGLQQGFQTALIEFVVTPLNPLLARFAVAIDDLSDVTEMLFGVKTVQDLNGLREQFRSGVPDPGRAIAQHHATGRLVETSTRGFAQYALGEVGAVSGLVSRVAALSMAAE